MVSKQYPTEERPDPIAERVGKGIFTDREREMDSLMEWVEMVAQKYGRSQVLISHRRHGKTAVMERLYNRLFWERDDVMPFYFEIHDGIIQIWMKELAEMYLYSFLQQFLAYRTRDATLAFSTQSSFEYLYKLAEKHNEQQVMDYITWWKKDTSVSDSLKIHNVLRDLPHDFATKTGLSIIVMFDEFQRLDEVLYYDEACTRQFLRYTQSYSGVVLSTNAPMLLAGSQVTMMIRQTLTGSMLGRVSFDYVERLPLSGAVELALRFAQRRKWDISLEMAYTMSRLVDGHPYYIWCLFHSKYRELDLSTEEGIQKTLTFEVENRAGHIYKFWYFHFLQHLEAFNLPHARKLIVYLAQYPDSEVHIEKILKDLDIGMPIVEANDLLQKLVWCDVVREEAEQFYGGVSDPMLSWMLRVRYSWELEELVKQDVIEKMQAQWQEETIAAYEELIGKMRSELNYWVGHVGEVFVKKFMANHFRDQVVDGARYFNQPGEIQLNRFTQIFDTTVQPYGSPNNSQIDIYAVPANEEHLPWVVEVKNWQNSVSRPKVMRFWESTQKLAQEKKHDEMVRWFHARGGFTKPARDFMDEKGILYTDEAGLTQMLRDFQVVEKWRESEAE